MPDRPSLVIITGMSGAGRSLASKALEDLGYFVIDNLPADLIEQVLARADLPESDHRRLAVVVDTRGGLDFDDLESVLGALATDGIPTTLLFLDADDEVLATRFEETRRPHPVEAGTLSESIATERSALESLRGAADVVIDTSRRTVHELREAVDDAFTSGIDKRPMRVAVTSFGFKHGVPRVADLVFDVRFLPNPHWIEELRPLTGLDAPVRDFVLTHADAVQFVGKLEDLLGFLLPRYAAEGKAYLTVAIGCTGGRHRSVAMAEALGEWLRGTGEDVTIRHRDAAR